MKNTSHLGTVAALGILAGSAAAQDGVTVTASSSTVVEGADARFVLVRTGATDTAATVDVGVTETGSMLGGAATRSVTFEADSNSATLTLPTVDDAVVESDSEVTVTVGSSSATVTVEDDDTAEFAFSVSPSGLSEADADSAAVTVTITNDVTFAKPQDIDVVLGGTAAAGADFVFTDAAARLVTKPFSLRLAAGQSEAAGVVTAVDDTVDDDAETVVVIASHSGASIGSAVIAIADDDDAAPALALAALSMSGNVGRAMYPAFDADTLHYAAGCSDDDPATVDSLTLAMSTESSGTRLAVDGIQVSNDNAQVPLSGLDGTSDIEIVLSNADGEARTYTVHCLDHDYPTITVTKQPGAWEGLIVGAVEAVDRRAAYQWSPLQIVDTNGVPWFRQRIENFRVAHIKPLQAASYAYGYARTPGPDKLQLLDENLEEAGPAIGPPSSAGSDEEIDNHDFAAKANDNIVMVTDDPSTRDLSAFTDDNGDPYSTNEAVNDEIIREVTPAGTTVFTWNTKDHMELVDCTQHRFTASEGEYSHFNSIEVVDGNLLVSFRGCAAVVMIDGSTGEVIWRLGRSNLSDDEWRAKGLKPPLKIVGDPYGEFCGQHSAKILGNGNLIIYDNGVHCLQDPDTGDTARTNNEFTRVVEYALDVDSGEAVFVRHHSYNDSFNAVTVSAGLVAPISNGNWLISWGRTTMDLPAVTEWDPVTNTELLHISYTTSAGVRAMTRAYPMRYDEFPAETAPLSAVFAESDFADEAYTGMSDSPQVVVAFNRPVADLAADSPSVSVTGATVASVRAHVVPGEAANAYIFTLTPTGTDAITFSLVADAGCASGGACTADGTMLPEVPAARELALDLPPTIDSDGAFDVAEATTAVATLAASDPDTPASQLVWSIPEGAAGGADADKFALSTAGVLALSAAKDFEAPDDADGDGTYEVTVQVSDGLNDVAAHLVVTLDNVIELVAIEGPSVVSFAENSWSRVATFAASSPQDRDGISWTLGGSDAAYFSIDEPSGALRFDLDPVTPMIVKKPPDFEAPVDSDDNNAYAVTLLPSAGSAMAASALSVTVTVTDADEDGTVSLSTKRPRTGVEVTATLEDPDDVVTGSATWVWQRSSGYNEWAAIAGADSSSYTPAAADAGSFLRVSVTYNDNHGSGAQTQATAPEVVAADLLSDLSITTNDSDATTSSDAWRRMRPAFDEQTLHYSVGCNNTDTMTLTMTPADASSRISIDGTQHANPGTNTSMTATRAVTGNSVVRIALTDAEGAQTQYVVHCLADNFAEITVDKPLGETGVLDELILFPFGDRLVIMDSNGVPRVQRSVNQRGRFYFRFYPDVNGEPRYSYTSGVGRVLDENLRQLAVARTVAPLTRQDSHDFRVLENGNYMLMAYQDTERDLSHLTFTDENGQPYGTDVYVEDSVIQIVTPSGVAVFNWNSWDHMPLEDCVQHFFPPGDGDYAHLNATHMVDGRIIASMRGCSRVLSIDVATGDVVWRVGPSNLSDAEWAERDIGPPPLEITGDPEGQFCGQHGTSLLPSGNLILYDNGAQCPIDPWTRHDLLRESDEFSRGVEYALDLDNGEAVFVRDHSLHGTRSEFGYRGGNIESLSNGHWLISWGNSRGRNPQNDPPSETMTQADPDTGEEWLRLGGSGAGVGDLRGAVMGPEALAEAPELLEAWVLAGSDTSVFHSGVGDVAQVAVVFNRPVADFGVSTPSLSVQGASVTAVAPLLVAGERANAYLVSLAPESAAAIIVSVVAGRGCDVGGVCAADGSTLSGVPSSLVIGSPVSVSFGAASYSVGEGSTLQVPVVLSRAHGGGVEIEVQIVASGLSASAGEFSVASEVSFAAGETRKTVMFDAADDVLVEGPETVELSLGALAPGFSEGSTAVATVTITDSDTAAIGFSVASSEVSEGGETELTFAITNGVTFAADQAIDITVAGSADAADDFMLSDSQNRTLSAPYSVTLAAGATQVSAVVRVVNDSDAELAETVVLSARLASTNTSIGSRTVTIPASDWGVPEVTITPVGAVSEGEDAVFTLRRTATLGTTLDQALSVRVEVTAIGGILSGAPPSTVTFTAGDGTAELRAATVNDTVVEDAATVTALVRADTASPARYVAGSPNSATITVRDNDVAIFSVSAGAAQVVEGDTETVTVRTGGVTFAQAQSLSVNVSGSAALDDDFVLTDANGNELSSPYQLTLPGGAGSTSLRIAAAADEVEDDGETVVLVVLHDGGSIGTATVTLVDTNDRPMVSGGSRFQFAENATTDVAAFTATDAEDDTVTWSLGGADAAWFDVAAGTLRFRSPPDFEMPTDVGTNNVYDVTVQASDSGGTAGHDVAVTVTDVDEAATVSGSFVVGYDENAAAAVAAFTAADPERATIRWTLGDDDSGDFEIIDRGVLSFVRPPDYEHPADADADNGYLVQVQARAGASDPVVVDVTVNVANVDEPGVLVLSSPQPQVGTPLWATVAEPDGVLVRQTWTWQRSLNGGPWSDIAGATARSYIPTFADEGHDLRVEATYLDGTGTDTADVQAPYRTRAAPSTPNSAPVFGGGPVGRSVEENAAPGTAVGAPVRPTDTDPGNAARLAHTLSDVAAGLFDIDGSTGQIRVGPAAVLDYEAAVRSYSVTVTATDPSGASGDVSVTVEVTDANEAPTAGPDTAVAAEDSRVVISVLSNDSDPDGDTLTVARRDAPLHGRVAVQADNTIAYTPTRDFNGKDIFTYTASDGRLTHETTVIVTVNAVNDQPKFPASSTTRTVAEGAPAAALVGHPVTAADVDGDALTYGLFEVDAPFFTIDEDTGQVRVGPNTVLDRRTQTSYRLRVEATDPHGARVSTALTVNVTAPGTTTTNGSVGTGGVGSGGGGGLEPSTAVIIVANGWSPPDIGVAAALAARTADSAVAYTEGDRLSVAARDLLVDYLPAGVIVIGGQAAVSDTVLASMRRASESGSVGRITGATRADTAAGVARRILDGVDAGGATVIVANGWSPADIGVAAALSARTPRSAVVYTAVGALPDATRQLLSGYRPARVLVVGGEAAVSPAVESEVRAAVPGVTFERVHGATRTATAAGVARRFLGPHQSAATGGLTVIVAHGWSPPDIGVAAALSARTAGSVVLYTEAGRLSGEAAEVLRDYRPTRVVFVGGAAAISTEAKDQARAVVPDATTPRYSGSTRTHTAANTARRILGHP